MMQMSLRGAIAASVSVVALVLAGPAAHEARAQAPPSRADQVVKYRQAMYTVIGGNFGPMAAMMTGKAPYDAKDFALRADRVAYVAKMLDEGFTPESKAGAPTKAKPQLWEDRAEFDRLLQDLQTRTAALARVAQSGDQAAIKPVFNDAGQACKSCHDKFRKKD